MASSFGAKRAENVSALLGEMVKRLVDVEVRATAFWCRRV